MINTNKKVQFYDPIVGIFFESTIYEVLHAMKKYRNNPYYTTINDLHMELGLTPTKVGAVWIYKYKTPCLRLCSTIDGVPCWELNYDVVPLTESVY